LRCVVVDVVAVDEAPGLFSFIFFSKNKGNQVL
jgi:hypothetical protein